MTDADGNIITVGSFNYPIDFDPETSTEYMLTSVGLKDIYIWKMAADGTFMWAKQIGGDLDQFVEDIAVDESGNIYLTGTFDGATDFDPGAATNTLTANGGQGAGDIFIAKYNSLGEYQWAQKIGASSSQSGKGITVDLNGDVYVTGIFFGTNLDFDTGNGTSLMSSTFGSIDLFLLKLHGDGTFVWVKKLNDYFNPSSNEYGEGVQTDDLGNVYLQGIYSSDSEIDFDPGAGVFELTPFPNALNIFIEKFDPSGNFVWARQIDPYINLPREGLKIDGNGNLMMCGYFFETADFDPGNADLSITSNGLTDIFISKWDTSGDHLWTKQIGGAANDVATSLALDETNSVYFTGSYAQTVDFDPGLGEVNLTYDSYDYNGYVCKLSDAGTYEWVVDFGGLNSRCSGSAVAVDANGDIVMSGIFYGSIDFDLSENTETLLTSQGLEDMCIVKLLSCSTLSALGNITGSSTVCPDATYTYTIPASSNADTYTWDLPNGWSGTSTTNSITLNTSTSSGIISVTAANDCSSSPPSNMNVSVTNVNSNVNLINNVLSSSQGSATYQWIDCNNNNEPIEGQTNQSFAPTANGSYAVMVTKNGCTVTSNCVQVTVIGLDENPFSETILIYPNPADENVRVQSDKVLSEISLTDLSGKIVLKNSNLNSLQSDLDLSLLEAGIYLMNIQSTTGETMNCKLMKK